MVHNNNIPQVQPMQAHSAQNASESLLEQYPASNEVHQMREHYIIFKRLVKKKKEKTLQMNINNDHIK